MVFIKIGTHITNLLIKFLIQITTQILFLVYLILIKIFIIRNSRLFLNHWNKKVTINENMYFIISLCNDNINKYALLYTI